MNFVALFRNKIRKRGSVKKSVFTSTNRTNSVKRKAITVTRLTRLKKCSASSTRRLRQWSQKAMKLAVAAILSGMGVRQASGYYCVPYGTLIRHVRVAKSNGTLKGMGRQAVFTSNQEDQLIECLQDLAAKGFCITKRAVCHAAYMFADLQNIPNPFDSGKKLAGRDWLISFLKRNGSRLSISRPQRLSKVKTTDDTQRELAEFYSLLKSALVRQCLKYQTSTLFST